MFHYLVVNWRAYDLIGVPQIIDGTSRFCPPKIIARSEPYCLFLDELNACSHEVQKAFYSLIHERRIGEYHLPAGSIVIGAGNRASSGAIVKPMSSALQGPHDSRAFKSFTSRLVRMGEE